MKYPLSSCFRDHNLCCLDIIIYFAWNIKKYQRFAMEVFSVVETSRTPAQLPNAAAITSPGGHHESMCSYVVFNVVFNVVSMWFNEIKL